MRKSRTLVAMGVMLATLATPALAWFYDITWIKHVPDPVVMGDVANISYDGPASPLPSSYEWKARQVGWHEDAPDFHCIGPWIPNPSTTNTAPYTFGSPGMYEVEMKCFYPPMMGLQPVTKRKVIRAMRPTTWVITKGLETPTLVGTDCEVRFELKTASRTIGPMPNALAQEWIYDQWTPVPGVVLEGDDEWTPTTAQPAFHLEGPWIVDKKGGAQPLLYGVNIGEVYYTCKQKLRLVYNTNCGEKIIDLPEARFRRRRVGTHYWQLEQY